MTTRLTQALIVLAATAGMATPALAEGVYAAVDVGQTKGADVCSGSGALGIAGCKDTPTAFRIAGGYQFTPNWGAEASYADYGSADLGMTTVPLLGVPAGTSLGNWKATAFEVAGIGTLPLANNVSLFAKLGVASTSLKLSIGPSASKTNLTGGVGAQYDFLRNFGVRVQYEDFGTIGDAASTGTTKLTLLSAGLVYRFY
jgi:OOP family OmpA-OmpF porin